MVVRKYNFDTPDEEHEEDWTIWWNEPHTKHAWAFIHFCRRSGDRVYVKGNQKSLNIALKRKL